MTLFSSPPHESWLHSRTFAATVFALLVLGFLIYTGHSAHLLGALPYFLILACPLMHLFMHGGHKHHHSHPGHDEGQNNEKHNGGCH